MIDNLIAIGTIGVVINLIMFFALRTLSKKFSQNMKNQLFDSMSYYSDLLKEKEERLQELNAQIESANSNQEIVVEEGMQRGLNLVEKHIEYRDDQFFNTYKLIKENFRRDYKRLIQEFIEKNVTGREDEAMDEYNRYKIMREKMNQTVCYELMTTVDEDLEGKLKSLFTKWEYEEIQKYRHREGGFDAGEFCDWLNEKLSQEAPRAVIKVSGELRDLETKTSYYEIQYDESLIEGVKILYKGRVFDYSL